MKTRHRFAASGCIWLGLVVALSAAGYGVSSENNPASDVNAAGSSAASNVGPLQHSPQQGAESSPPTLDLTNPEGVASYCESLARSKGRPDALEAVCQYALSLRWKLPNVICEQSRSRYQEGQTAAEAQRNKVTARVRYEDGKEEYSDVKVDGKAVETTVENSGEIWSQGEFALDLRGVFSPQVKTEFRFAKEDTLHATRVLIFDFKIDKKNNRMIGLAAGKITVYPGYRGRLWVDKAALRLMKFQLDVDDIESDFPMQQATTQIDYQNVALGDGTDFVLPVRAVDMNCPTGASIHCWHDRLTFTHWHKFASRTRFLAEEPTNGTAPSAPAVAVAPPPAVDLFAGSMDLRRGSAIAGEALDYEFAEIQNAEKLVEARALAQDALKTPAPKIEVSANSSPPPPAEPGVHDDQVAVLRSRVRLVLVPAVVRDAKERTVDTLQKDDFRLFDDRHPQLITQFSFENDGTVLAGDTRSAKSSAANSPAARFEAYLFDDVHASQGDLFAAREAAKHHLAELPAGDRVAIFALSGTVVLDFTSDIARLNEALTRLRPHPSNATGSFRCPNITYPQADLIANQRDAIAIKAAIDATLICAYAGAQDSASRAGALRLVESTASEVVVAGRTESLTSFKVLNAVISGMSQMRGPRVIVLVSPGFPLAAMEDAESKLIDDALRAGVVINVLDPSGVSSSSGIEYGSASLASDVLADLTSGSGGVFFRNKNNLDEGFRRTSLPESFYMLGFSPPKQDGKFHKLKVTVQVPAKLIVQARRGYYAPKPEN